MSISVQFNEDSDLEQSGFDTNNQQRSGIVGFILRTRMFKTERSVNIFFIAMIIILVVAIFSILSLNFNSPTSSTPSPLPPFLQNNKPN